MISRIAENLARIFYHKSSFNFLLNCKLSSLELNCTSKNIVTIAKDSLALANEYLAEDPIFGIVFVDELSILI